MTELTQSLDHGITEILVRVEPSHRLCLRILLKGLLNLLTMGVIICPSGLQIRLSQIGVMFEDASIR